MATSSRRTGEVRAGGSDTGRSRSVLAASDDSCRRHCRRSRNTSCPEGSSRVSGKMRTALGVPLLRESDPNRRDLPCPPTSRAVYEKPIDFVTTFADQAVMESKMPGCSMNCATVPTSWRDARTNCASPSTIWATASSMFDRERFAWRRGTAISSRSSTCPIDASSPSQMPTKTSTSAILRSAASSAKPILMRRLSCSAANVIGDHYSFERTGRMARSLKYGTTRCRMAAL